MKMSDYLEESGKQILNAIDRAEGLNEKVATGMFYMAARAEFFDSNFTCGDCGYSCQGIELSDISVCPICRGDMYER